MLIILYFCLLYYITKIEINLLIELTINNSTLLTCSEINYK